MREGGGLQKTAQQLFEGLAESYDSVLNYATIFQDRYWKKYLLENVDLAGLKVLDLACGTCVLEERIPRVNCEVVGLDLSERMIRIAKLKKNALVSSLVLADAEMIPFGEQTFDVVLSCYLPKYCQTGMLSAEIWRVLKPRGRVLLYDFSRPRGFFGLFHATYVYGFLRLLGAIARRTAEGLEGAFTRLPEIIRESRWDESLRGDFARAGFTQVEEKVLTGGVVTTFFATKGPAFP